MSDDKDKNDSKNFSIMTEFSKRMRERNIISDKDNDNYYDDEFTEKELFAKKMLEIIQTKEFMYLFNGDLQTYMFSNTNTITDEQMIEEIKKIL